MLQATLFCLAVCAGPPIIVVGGQSLSAGAATSPRLTTTQTLGNQMVSGVTYDTFGGASTPYIVSFPSRLHAWPLVDLTEADAAHESPRSAAGNYYATATGVPTIVTPASKGGAAYVDIKRGTEPFHYFNVATESLGARVGAWCAGAWLVHGESDHNAGTSRAQYTANLIEYQADIEAKCRASTRTQSTVVLYVDQFSAWTATLLTESTTSLIPLAVYDAARTSNGKVKIVQPHYNFTHQPGDGVHLLNTASRAMGANGGKAIAAGPSWQPLWPVESNPVSRSGAVITVSLYTPTPPLVVDTTNITGVSAATRGFEYTCGSSPPAISSVDCSAACSGNICSCAITLASTPGAPCLTDDKIGYALTGVLNNEGGPTSGPRGNIRDSDTATWQGAALYNWLIHFQEDVPN